MSSAIRWILLDRVLFAGDGHSVVVTWSTLNSTSGSGEDGQDESFVSFGTQPWTLRTKSLAQETKFVDGGAEKSTQYIHRATMDGLKSDTVYCKR